VRLVEAIRRANQPSPPEDSVRLRLACTGAVLVSIAACAALGEMSRPTEWIAMLLVPLGMAFSYATRARPPEWVKLAVAVGAVGALAWFFHEVSARPVTDITTVENPLTVLFVCILVVHSFHVPARRDLLFSLGASAGLMAVGAAQAIDLRYGIYALAWVACVLWALIESWTSVSHGGRISAPGVSTAVLMVALTAAAIFLLLPAPIVAVHINFLDRAGSGGAVPVPGALAGDAGQPSELSRAGSPSGPTRVGGYLGFANTLDTALRGKLSHKVVMRVRAERPSYWVGETFDTWDGQSWSASSRPTRTITNDSPFIVPLLPGSNVVGSTDLQTFYITSATADLIFHAESASEVWFPTPSLFYSADGTIVSTLGIGRGAIYTVQSVVDSGTPDQLRHATGAAIPASELNRYLQLPHPYPQVEALATAVTAGATTTYDRVEDLIGWVGANTRYSTAIPPLPPGVDTVNEFLFGNRTGYCEQISTALAVMLRTLGIPAREVVGYVPGSYNPVTDLYTVKADDAHAWVQVWIPGYGWQSFDPTASVPLANPDPGATALHDVAVALAGIPLWPAAVLLAAAGLTAVVIQRTRRRPVSWAEQIARTVEGAGRRAGRPRRQSETFLEYATALDELRPDGGDECRRLAADVEASAYGGREPPPEIQRLMTISARHLRLPRRLPGGRRAGGRLAGERLAGGRLAGRRRPDPAAPPTDRAAGPPRRDTSVPV
jgi:transglutaminase-like putative cysteine protease